jgi:hypothetical protein
MKRAATIIRAMFAEGRHLQNCFADPAIRHEGYRLAQRTRRIANRLGYKLTAFVPMLVFWLAPLTGQAAPTPAFAAKLADAIYVAEGGTKARVPYGVLSIKPPANVKTPEQLKAWARRITLNSIANNWRRWESAGRPGTFVKFIATRWCPPSADPQGHTNWVRNVTKLLGKDAL